VGKKKGYALELYCHKCGGTAARWKKKGYSLHLYCHKCGGTAARWKKKAFSQKEEKTQKLFQLPIISNCPDLCPLTYIGCWRSTELQLLPRTLSLSLERSVSRALSLSLDLFLSFLFFFLPLVLFLLVISREVFFFFFFVKQRVREMAPIAVGDKIPDGTLFYLNSDGKPTAFPVYESLKGSCCICFILFVCEFSSSFVCEMTIAV
jgi:hypothetical protein